MSNGIKQMGVMLSAALLAAVVSGCGGAKTKQSSQAPLERAEPTGSSSSDWQPMGVKSTFMERTAKPAPTAQPAPAMSAESAPVQSPPSSRTSQADELDVAIRDASDCLNDNIPKGSKIVILNIESSSANLSEYIIDELIANAINDKNFSVVDRRQLEAIQSEQKFQMSGAVDDKDALAIGKFFGAQTIVSGVVREMGGRHRMAIRALAVQTAVMQSQCNQTIGFSATLTDLVRSGGVKAAGGAAAASSVAATAQSAAVSPPAATPTTTATAPTAPAAPQIQGTMVPGNSLSDKLAWLTRSADSHNTYIMELNADDKIAPSYSAFDYKGAINITIVLRGDNENRTIRLRSNGTMFYIPKEITFILDNNITLMGHKGNGSELVSVGSGGTFKMNAGAKITGNDGCGVKVNSGTLSSGTFEMTGGEISGNGNPSYYGGGGVNVGGKFTMTGGIISNNTAKTGGGVYTNNASFTMRGGTIAGNTAREYGGGVYRTGSGDFNKTGGTITGYNSDQTNGNVVRDEDDNVLARRGHAVYVHTTNGYNTRREATAGQNVNLSWGWSKGKTGDWDD